MQSIFSAFLSNLIVGGFMIIFLDVNLSKKTSVSNGNTTIALVATFQPIVTDNTIPGKKMH